MIQPKYLGVGCISHQRNGLCLKTLYWCLRWSLFSLNVCTSTKRTVLESPTFRTHVKASVNRDEERLLNFRLIVISS